MACHLSESSDNIFRCCAPERVDHPYHLPRLAIQERVDIDPRLQLLLVPKDPDITGLELVAGVTSEQETDDVLLLTQADKLLALVTTETVQQEEDRTIGSEFCPSAPHIRDQGVPAPRKKQLARYESLPSSCQIHLI